MMGRSKFGSWRTPVPGEGGAESDARMPAEWEAAHEASLLSGTRAIDMKLLEGTESSSDEELLWLVKYRADGLVL